MKLRINFGDSKFENFVSLLVNMWTSGWPVAAPIPTPICMIEVYRGYIHDIFRKLGGPGEVSSSDPQTTIPHHFQMLSIGVLYPIQGAWQDALQFNNEHMH